MYDSILVATDGSPAAEHAVDHALDLAETYGATVRALYVLEITDAGEMSAQEPADPNVDLEAKGREVTDRIVEAADDVGVEAVAEVVEGRPHEAILDCAADRGVDLIVVGTHGKTGLSRVLLGSVAERIVRNASVPVLAVQPDETDDSAR